MTGGLTRPTVTGLYYYPVKSLAGIPLSEAVLTPRGIQNDRRWMLVRESGRFITQREEHSLARLRLRATDTGFHIRSPDGSATTLPAIIDSGPSRRVTVWKDDVLAVAGPKDAADFFAAYLGYPCNPVFMPAEADRTVREFAPPETPLSFADAYPGLLTTEASFDHLNGLTGVDLIMQRFRPNVVATAHAPYDEDTWAHVRIGEAEIACVKPCSRCVLTTVDPVSGNAGKEPLKTLARYRRIGNDVFFGQNFVVSKPGIVRLGDEIEILQRKDPLFDAGYLSDSSLSV